MKYSLASSALVLAGVTSVFAQGESSRLAPSTSAPSGCSTSYDGSFEVQIVAIDPTMTPVKRSEIMPTIARRQAASNQCAGQGTLVANLNDGILTDAQGRIGSIVSNRQFQFDGPPAQAGAIYTAGWSVCEPSRHLALGDSTIFYQCASGNFFNIYDEPIAEQCTPVYIEAIPCDGSAMGMNGAGSGLGNGMASGSNMGSGMAAGSTNQIADGQIQNGISQIADGQLQVPSQPAATAAMQIGDGQIQNGRGGVNQIADGQIQNGGGVNQIADGQIQNGGNNANQIADGQIQNGGAGVNQIADGQIQNGGAGVNQIADGQIQNAGVNQIADGQIQNGQAGN